jgi:predicted anti-sigma-YlaC factor YlaD
MIDCRQIMAQLSDYLDGEVSPHTRQMVETHLAKCRRCSLVYSTTRQTLTIVTTCGAFAIPVSAGTRLHAGLKELLAGN